ncbi:hypothetical protein C0Q70_09083 [Pomacea canaliculata]|uniref:Ionotropic glutamate receptor C-terminal domain-containing protein n=1 Tax=Pomacea canaliculata TaxID=400727 RepID=A0A2T7P8U9_POMCA|nr:hypothetical protein C0Q70_09083 [Pomacea canaliculata]
MWKKNPNIPSILHSFGNYSNVALPSVQFHTIIATNDSSALSQVCDELRDGVVAVVDMTSPRNAQQLRWLSGVAGLAYISVVDDSYFGNSQEHERLHARVEPTAVQMLKIVTDIVIQENLNNVALVYDDTFDIQNLPRRILVNVPAQHLYVRLDQSENATQRQVRMLKDVTIQNIFIIADTQNAQRFLLEVRCGYVFDVYDLFRDSAVNCGGCRARGQLATITAEPSAVALQTFVAFMQRHVTTDDVYNSSDVKVDEAVAFDLAVLIRSSMPSVAANLVYDDCSALSSVDERDLEQSRRLIDALQQARIDGVFGAISTQDNLTSFSMTLSINKHSYKDGLQTEQVMIGSWTKTRGLNLTQSLILADRRPHYMVVTVSGNHPFVYKDIPANFREGPSYYGYCIELLQLIAKQLQFNYTIYESPDGKFGTMDDNGKWSGMIGELIEKRADMAVGPISIMAERESVVDFTVPYYDLPRQVPQRAGRERLGLHHRRFPRLQRPHLALRQVQPYSHQNTRKESKEGQQEARVFTFKEGIWFCLMSLTPQGGGETPRAFSGRLVAATWWLFGFIIIATYTANLAAFLTVSRLETSIESLDDLSKQFKVKIWKDMSLSNSISPLERARLAVWDYPVSDKYTKLWNNMQANTFPRSTNEAIEMVLNGDFALISDATTNKYATYTNCELMVVGEEFSRKPYAFAVQEGSPLRDEVSNVILQLINQRQLEDMKSRWWLRDKLNCPDIEDESDGISIRNIGGVFLVIAVGSAIALVVLVMECYW